MSERWLTFDCFGTLVDWQTGMSDALKPVAGSDHERLLSAYHAEELVAEHDYKPYREVLQVALRRAADSTGIPLADTDDRALVDAWGALPVYPDVGPALQAARDAGWSLCALTNCDDDLFAETKRTLPVQFDLVVTAQQVGAYKPELAHFRRFAEQTGATRANWIHCACSWIHDVLPASRMGIRSLWIDRDRTGHPAAQATRRAEDMQHFINDITEVEAA